VVPVTSMPSAFLAMVVFTVITLGLGHGVLWLARATRPANPLTAGLETAAVGVAAFSLLGVVLVLVHIPLRVEVYVALAIAGPILSALGLRRAGKRAREPVHRTWWTRETLCGALLLALLGCFFAVYYKGATSYPFLEDDDPWLHAQGALYIAKAHTYRVDPSLRALGYAKYLEPYPPTYDVLMALMRQVDGSIRFTLKFFNVVLVTLALGFSFLFCKTYLRSDAKGLFATLVLAVLPSFMSHFIWSQSLALCVFPVAMYAALKALDDKTWTLPAVLAIASMMVTQPVVSFVFGLVFGLMVVHLSVDEAADAGSWRLASLAKTRRAVFVGAAGLATSCLYWGAQLATWGLSGILVVKGSELTTGWAGKYALTRTTLAETVFPQMGRIDQATGWGPVVTLGLLVGLACAWTVVTAHRRAGTGSSRSWVHAHLIVWFLLLSYAAFAPSFGLPAWGTARSWAYLAIPVALLTTEGVFFVAMFLSALFGGSAGVERAVVGLAAVGIVATSAPAKIATQTAYWPPGVDWVVGPTPEGQEALGLRGYLQMQDTLPRNTRVYAFCGDARPIGFDMESSPWVQEEAAFARRGADVTAADAIEFLDTQHYSYFTFDASCMTGERDRRALLHALGQTSRVQAVVVQPGFILARLSPG
jgi:hypothetical protein